MKNRVLKTIRFTSLLLVILLFLPTFSLWAVEAPEGEAAETAAEVQAQNESLSAALTASLEEESMLFQYVDRASFIEAGHIERVVEDEELNTYVFKNPDGSKTMYFLGEDVKYLSAQGVQQEKRLDLVALDSGYTTRSSDVSLALPNAISKGVTLAYNGNSVTLTPMPQTLTGGTATLSAGSALTDGTGANLTADLEATLMEQALQIAPIGISTGKADYQGVFGTGTTLRYTPTLSGVKEDVILDAYRGQNTFAFTLSTGSLSVFEENEQYFIAESAEAEEKILISETWVYDSADHFERGTLTVTPVKAGLYLLTVGASVDFLTDESTVYPVYIDPSLEISYGKTGSGYIEDATVFEGIPNVNCGSMLYCTVGASSSYGRGRTAIRLTGLIDYEFWEKISYQEITSTKFYIKEASGTSSTKISVCALENDTWTESTATWNNLGTYNDTKSFGTASLTNSKEACFDITGLVRDEWRGGANGRSAEQGFILVSKNETTPIKQFYSSEYSNTSIRPYVEMTYTPKATITSDVSFVAIGQTLPLNISVTLKPEDIVSVTWSIADDNIASIDATTGVVLGKAVGKTTVTATVQTVNDGSITATKELRVIALSDGAYLLKVPGMSLYATAQSSWQLNGMAVTLDERADTQSLQQYWILKTELSSYSKLNPLSSTGCMVPHQNSIALWQENEGFSRNWHIEKTSDGKYTLQYIKGGYLSHDTDTNTVSVSDTAGENTKWEIISCREMILGAKLFDIETGSELIAASKTITIGDKKTFEELNIQPVFYSTCLDLTYTWSSSDTAVAKINAEGDGIIGVSPGTATIIGTVNSAGLQETCSFTVTVQSLPDGIYYLKNPSTFKVVRVSSSAPYTGGTTIMMPASDFYTYLWRFEQQSDGYYTIRSLLDSTYYLTAPATNASSTAVTLQSGSITDAMKWALSVTEAGNFILTSKNNYGTSTVLALSDTSGSDGITVCQGAYVSNKEYSDEWLIRKNEVYYVEHYYDIGFTVRYGNIKDKDNENVLYNALDVIKAAETAFVQKMDARFGITVISTYNAFQSTADRCKLMQSAEGTITAQNIENSCTHNGDEHLTTAKLHAEISTEAQNEVSRVIWTGHKLTGNPSSSAKQSKKTTVITLKKNYNESTKEYETEFNAIVVNYTNTVRHELGHLLSLNDHYCYIKDHGYENCQAYCDICEGHREAEREGCIMSKTENTKFCFDCYKNILTYILALENNKVGE